jgi:hypothetical protein
MMYAFAQRADCAVWDEPFYSPYLAATGARHPMREEILAAHETDPERVAAAISGSLPAGKPHFYMKHMAHHMVEGFPLDWARGCANVFLIRHPARVVASYARKREGPSLDDLGFAQLSRLHNLFADWMGSPPAVIDSADIRANPRASLGALCAKIGLPFDPKMLSWPAGGRPEDGVWAGHWYGAVHRSTGFEEPDGPLPELSGEYARLVERAMPHYEVLGARRLRPPTGADAGR